MSMRDGVLRAVVPLLLLACGETHPALREPDPEVLRVGETIYSGRCARCHGPRGEGAPDWKQPIAPGVFPPPPHDSTGHTWHHADGLLFRVVTRGSAKDSAGRGVAPAQPQRMPAFRDSLSAVEIRAVITYLKGFWTEEQRIRQWEVTKTDPFPAPQPGQR
jgi:mono/diheme cytochrome c family protein